MKYLMSLLTLLALLGARPLFAEEEPLTPEQEQYLNAARNLWESLDRRTGEVTLLEGVVTLEVPEDFYYLSPADAERVLVEVWGNPPGAGADTLGMLFPSEYTPFHDEAWAVTIEYEAGGYVSDENADDIDYADLLAQMQEDTREASRERVREGYEAIELIGWAAEPYYDRATHKLHWAKEIHFGDEPVNTLNYNIRVLGRGGVLVLNFIAGMDQKAVIDERIDSVLALADFNQGSRYEDFNPDIDQVAAYGIGALVAGKVAAKTGLLAAALVFLKKFGVMILVGIGALLGRLFKRKTVS